jgi:parallel beta-helix repeat protein
VIIGSSMTGSAEVPSGWSEAARDSFSRTVSDGWGSADVGGVYKIGGSANAVSASGSTGVVKLSAGREFAASLPSVSIGDVDISDTAKVTGAATYDLFHGWGVRRQDDGSSYNIRVRFSSSGKSTLGVSRRSGATSTWLSGVSLPMALQAGQTFHGNVQVTGTSPVLIRARVWADGSSKPGWQLSYSDSDSGRITGKGPVALRDYAKTADSQLTITRDNLSVGAAGTVAQSPTESPSPSPSAPATPTSSSQPTQSGSRGSVAIGSANYGVPSGAVFVDGKNGSNSNSGSQSSPLRTIQAGVDKVASGMAVVVRAGIYHESVASGKTITLQNYPGEAVWLDGSVPITNWTKAGTTWVTSGWKSEFSSSMGGDSSFKSRFIGSNSMAADPDQVFINGTALKQVSSAGAVTAGTFYVSDAANTITIGTDPSGKEIRASDLSQALYLTGPDAVLQGIGFRRYANPYELKGAVRLGGSGGTVRNVVIEDVATIGLSMSKSNKTVDHVTVRRAGQLGLGGHQTDGSVVSNSIVSGNNTELFKDEPVSGGMKFTAARTMTAKNNEVSNNNGSGIWFDVSSYNMTIVNNTANSNTKHGIEAEVSSKGIIANNQAVNGGEDGIILLDAADFKVFNNEVGGAKLFGIKLGQDERRQSKLGSFSEARDSRYANVVDPNITWITKNIQLCNNVFGNGGSFQIYMLDGRTNRAVDTWNVTINGNLFNKRVVKTDPTMVAWGKGDNATLERYETPAALAAAKNGSWKNAQISTSKPILSMASDETAHASTAVPIPADVADATGRLTGGSRVLGVN